MMFESVPLSHKEESSRNSRWKIGGVWLAESTELAISRTLLKPERESLTENIKAFWKNTS